LVFSGAALTYISANVLSPTTTVSDVKILTVSGFFVNSPYYSAFSIKTSSSTSLSVPFSFF
jgi:hypothetical protein